MPIPPPPHHFIHLHRPLTPPKSQILSHTPFAPLLAPKDKPDKGACAAKIRFQPRAATMSKSPTQTRCPQDSISAQPSPKMYDLIPHHCLSRQFISNQCLSTSSRACRKKRGGQFPGPSGIGSREVEEVNSEVGSEGTLVDPTSPMGPSYESYSLKS